MKRAALDVLPLGLAAVCVVGWEFLGDSIFAPDSDLVPWIYFARLVPWILIFGLALVVRHWLNRWPIILRTVFLAIVGIWVAFPLSDVFSNITDASVARQRAAHGDSDPYNLYSDESGMRNHGTSQLGKDTIEAIEGAVVLSILFSPVLFSAAFCSHYLNNKLESIKVIPS